MRSKGIWSLFGWVTLGLVLAAPLWTSHVLHHDWASFLGENPASSASAPSFEGDFIGPEIPPRPEVERFEDFLPSNTTLQSILARHDFSPQQVHQFIQETRPVYNLNRVMAGQRYAIELVDGAFHRFEYDISDEEYLVVRYDSGRYEATRRRHEFEVRVEGLVGHIKTSAWDALVGQGETGDLAMKLFQILQWDVDFTRVYPDDSFRLIFEKKYLGNQFVKYGNLLAVEFRSRGKAFYAFQFVHPETGEKQYYNQDGEAVRKAFLKVPFSFNPRISSGFSHSRFHPVLKKRRPHYGVDYAAPAGTPVLASGSGTVIFAGYSGGNGKMVKIRHSNGYVTSYLHLSSISVRVGQQVAQGERIGRVGSTGLATGPHLDYRIQNRRGQYLNPQNVMALPSDKPVDPRYREEFFEVRDRWMRQLQSIPAPEVDEHRFTVAG